VGQVEINVPIRLGRRQRGLAVSFGRERDGGRFYALVSAQQSTKHATTARPQQAILRVGEAFAAATLISGQTPENLI
jgi:hypothetical protein